MNLPDVDAAIPPGDDPALLLPLIPPSFFLSRRSSNILSLLFSTALPEWMYVIFLCIFVLSPAKKRETFDDDDAAAFDDDKMVEIQDARLPSGSDLFRNEDDHHPRHDVVDDDYHSNPKEFTLVSA